jgi:hypothetical protein
MGPAQYDLASLLRDSYVTLPEEPVELLTAYYGRSRETKDKAFLPGSLYIRCDVPAKLQGAGDLRLSVVLFGVSTDTVVDTLRRTCHTISASYPEFTRFRSAVEDLI